MWVRRGIKIKRNLLHSSRRFAGGELKHGTIALIENGTPVIALATQEHVNLKFVVT